MASTAWSQGYGPDVAASKMTIVPGFEVTLTASEPIVRQPVCIEFDDRGRLWVIQYLQYPNPAGLKRVEVDRYSRTKYDHVPDPPPIGPKGADVITILEDTDGDGRADSYKNFLEGLNLASGIAFGYGGVFVIQPPYLLFYPDKNADDVPDGAPEVCVKGFGMEDAHSVANSLTWGPDGWLYGLQGSTVTANINGIEFQQGVWRYHPRTKRFELFCEGGGNQWGADFDWKGNLLVCTNYGPYVAMDAKQGAYYWKSFGKHGALHNPYTYGYFEHCTQHNPQGGHVADGGIIYEADTFPEPYRGKFIVNNLLSHDIYWHTITPVGSTFDLTIEGQFLNSNDTWFAPSDMTLGPDGCLYTADWSDKRTAHPDPDAEWDRSNGRVYRLAPKGTPLAKPIDLNARSTDELVALLDHPNKWFVRRALVHLGELRDASLCPVLKKRVFDKKLTEKQQVTALFALNASGGFDARTAQKLLDHPSPSVRRWAVRFLGDEGSVDKKIGKHLIKLAQNDPDVAVRSQLASTAKRVPADFGVPMAFALAQRDEDKTDLHVPLLTWWAIEGHAMANVDGVFAELEKAKASTSALLKDEILTRLMRRFAADGSPAGDRACVRMLEMDEGWQNRPALLASLDAGMQDNPGALRGPGGGELFATVAAADAKASEARERTYSPKLVAKLYLLWSVIPQDPVLLRMAIRTGNRDAYKRAWGLALNSTTEEKQRVEMLQLVGRFGNQNRAPMFLNIFRSADSENVKRAALEALRRLPGTQTSTALLDTYASSTQPIQKAIRETLFARPDWSTAFLATVEAGKIKPEDVPVDELRSLANHNDEALNALVEKHWGAIRPGTPEERLADMRRMNNELNAAPGDPARGKLVFTENCSKCHTLFGEGAKFAPELTQANRFDRDYLLASLVDPNLTVRKEYMQYVINTKDGSCYNGLIVEKTPGSITLLNASAAKQVIPTSDIEEMRETDVSIMPEGLITVMKGDTIRDLFAYLQSKTPVTASK